MSDADIIQAATTALLLLSPTKIDALILDVSVSETHSGDVDVTTHPVEQGFAVADHARPMPDKLTIEGVVSNTPLSKSQQRRIVQAFGVTFESVTDADHIIGQPGYAEQAYTYLRTLREHPKLITVTTRLRTYENMLMTSLVIPRNKDTGDAFKFTAVFQLVRIVANKSTVAKNSKTSTGPKKQSAGKKVPDKTDKATQEKSWAYEIAEKTGLLEKLGIKLPPKP